MRRPEPNEYHPAFAHYVSLVPESDLVAAFEAQRADSAALFASIDESRGGHRYAEGKWSIRELLGHLSDGERALGYRVFAISRGDEQPLPGFEENSYIENANYDSWSVADLVNMFTSLRRANVLMMAALSEEAWDRFGTANGNRAGVRGIAYAMLGHERHHLKVLRERYL